MWTLARKKRSRQLKKLSFQISRCARTFRGPPSPFTLPPTAPAGRVPGRAKASIQRDFAQLCVVYPCNFSAFGSKQQRFHRPFLCMRYLKTSEAAALLNVSPNTLRAWERRFGFPKPQRSPGKHRLFTHGEVAALRDALQDGLSISSAVSRAREGLAADSNSLVGALVSYERERADQAIEAALALRSVERSVEEVLLPTLEEIARRHTTESAAWAFAAHWGADWLRRATRLAPPPIRPVSIVLGDASRDELDLDAPHIRALELFCVRAGIKVLSLSARGVAGIGDAVAVHRPNLVVLAGGYLADDTVAR